MNGLEVVDILLIEDDADDAELTIRALKKNKITNNVYRLNDGAKAMNYLFPKDDKDIHPNPKVIFLDLKLPKINGLQILKALKANERTKLIPIVVLTSSQEDKDVIESYKFGVNSYIMKPIDFDKFVTVVGELGLYWVLMNQPIKK